MNIVRWDPFRELEGIQARLNRMFGEYPQRGSDADNSSFPEWAPAVDVEEIANEQLIKAEHPDVKKENVKVEFDDGILTVEGERKLENKQEGKKFLKNRARVRQVRSSLRSADGNRCEPADSGLQGGRAARAPPEVGRGTSRRPSPSRSHNASRHGRPARGRAPAPSAWPDPTRRRWRGDDEDHSGADKGLAFDRPWRIL